MSKKVYHWLRKEIPLWQEKGWISDSIAHQMEAHYADSEAQSTPSLIRIFIILLSAFLIGAGIFLLFAGYWYSFSPIGRFDWVITLLILSLIILGLAAWKAPCGSAFAEGATLFYMLALGGGTFLLGDTYYTGESLGLYLILVMLFTLPAIYLLRAGIAMIVYLLVSLLWCILPTGIQLPIESYVVWVLIIATIPFYITTVKESRSYTYLMCLSWAYVAAIFGAFFMTVESYKAGVELYYVACLSMITHSLGVLAKDKGVWTIPFRTIGSLGFIYVLIKGTLLQTWKFVQDMSMTYVGIGSALILGIIALFFFIQVLRRREVVYTLMSLVPLVLMGLYFAAYQGMSPLLISLILDTYVLVVAIFLLIRGTVQRDIAYINGAILAVGSMVLARFFDPSFTFIERGLSFLLAGIVVMIVNLLYLWRKRAHQARLLKRENAISDNNDKIASPKRHYRKDKKNQKQQPKKEDIHQKQSSSNLEANRMQSFEEWLKEEEAMRKEKGAR